MLGWLAPAGQAYSSVRDLITLTKMLIQSEDSTALPHLLTQDMLKEFLLPGMCVFMWDIHYMGPTLRRFATYKEDLGQPIWPKFEFSVGPLMYF